MSQYPASLPGPSALQMVPADRRQSSLTQSRPVQRDRAALVRVQFPPITQAQMAVFKAWWVDTLEDGAAWFSAQWPTPRGQTLQVYRFVAPPSRAWVGGGFWKMSAELEWRSGAIKVEDPLLVFLNRFDGTWLDDEKQGIGFWLPTDASTYYTPDAIKWGSGAFRGNGHGIYKPCASFGPLLTNLFVRASGAPQDFTLEFYHARSTNEFDETHIMGMGFVFPSTGVNVFSWRNGTTGSGNHYVNVWLPGLAPLVGSIVPSDGAWRHYAVENFGGTVRLYVDGVPVADASAASITNATLTGDVTIGKGFRNAAGAGIHIDSIRLKVQQAVYQAGASTFTPPASDFPGG